jgi:hypothetical protein
MTSCTRDFGATRRRIVMFFVVRPVFGLIHFLMNLISDISAVASNNASPSRIGGNPSKSSSARCCTIFSMPSRRRDNQAGPLRPLAGYRGRSRRPSQPRPLPLCLLSSVRLHDARISDRRFNPLRTGRACSRIGRRDHRRLVHRWKWRTGRRKMGGSDVLDVVPRVVSNVDAVVVDFGIRTTLEGRTTSRAPLCVTPTDRDRRPAPTARLFVIRPT